MKMADLYEKFVMKVLAFELNNRHTYIIVDDRDAS